MSREGSFAVLGGTVTANAILLGAAMATSRPLYYLAMAAVVGTFVNLTFLAAGRLWQQRP